MNKTLYLKYLLFSPHSNIVPIDYDPGDTNVNQINRIELMLSVARERELFK